tara:strand:- start:1151 stop:3058 length:1908 start_codon:yes stop_codon:yes gene_type:complete
MNDQLALALNIPPPKVHPLPPNWAPFDLAQLPTLSGVCALDFETKDPGIGAGIGSSWAHEGAGFACGVSIAWAGGAFYLPVTHSSGNVLIWEVQEWLTAQATNPDVTFVMANSTYDTGWLWRWGIVPVNAPFDVQGMATLLDEHRTSYSLDNLARHYLQRHKGSGDLVTAARDIGIPHPMSNMDRLPAWIVEPYAVDDAVLTLALYHHLMPMIEAQGLVNILDIERRASMAAGDMRRRGVRVDVDKAERIKQGFILKRDAAIADIARITGVNVTPWDNVAILQALRVENPALVVDHTPTGKEALRKEFVDALGTPVAKAVAHARHLDKSINTFFDGFIHKYAYRGRIHAEFHTLRRTDDEGYGYGTITGRLSCSNPNLQQIPARDPEIGPAIRSCFLPEEGEQWLSADYSSQEPRWTIHYAAQMNLPGAAAMVERFRVDPRTDLHGETAALMGVKRTPAKTINLAIAYGAGGAKICQQLGLPTRMKEIQGRMIEIAGVEGQALIDRHAEAVPYIRGLAKAAKERAERQGYVTSFGGRRMRFRKGFDGKVEQSHKALNKLIQSCAATQNKIALARLRDAGIPVMISIHDSAEVSVPLGAEGERMRSQIVEIMEGAVELLVPSVVDVKVGADWGSLK